MLKSDAITPEQAGTLAGLFKERVRRSPSKVAYKHYDADGQKWVDTTWHDMANEVGRWQQAMLKLGLKQGDRVAVMLPNCREWVLFDQAALGLGLVSVPVYMDDRAENVAYILGNAGVKFLVIEGKEQWLKFSELAGGLPSVEHILSIHTMEDAQRIHDPRLFTLSDWLFGVEGKLQLIDADPGDLASIVYTSGTTGSPKGVMLSHRNMLANAWAGQQTVELNNSEVFLSFLPLSHTLERTVGYYLPIMAGSTVAYSRSIAQLAEDLLEIRPTLLLSVPRIFERVYTRVMEQVSQGPLIKRSLFKLAQTVGWRRFQYKQGDVGWSPLLWLWPLLYKLVGAKIIDKLGGNIRMAICGGAPLQSEINEFFLSMGLELMQGYGLTEASPVIAVNRPEANKTGSIGLPLPGVQVRIAENGELQSKSECVMLGYWKDEEGTAAVFTDDGWLKTGDIASQDEDGFLYITGRIKDILVLSNGEKVPPADMEMAIILDPLFEQALVIGEARPCLTALIVLNEAIWHEVAKEYGVDPGDKEVLRRADINHRILNRAGSMLKKFPGYAQLKKVHLLTDPWTVEEGLLTPTLKIKRASLLEKYSAEIEEMYSTR